MYLKTPVHCNVTIRDQACRSTLCSRIYVLAHLARFVNPPTPAPNDTGADASNVSEPPERVSSPVDLPPGEPMKVMVDEEVVDSLESS